MITDKIKYVKGFTSNEDDAIYIINEAEKLKRILREEKECTPTHYLDFANNKLNVH